MKKWAIAGLAMQMALGLGTAQAAQKEVKIGVMTDMSGPDSDNSGAGSVLAAQMAVEDAGGMAGDRKIVLISADHQRKADVASALANRWYDNEGVDAIVDVPLSSAALAIQEIARQRNKVVMFSTAATSDLTGKACSPTGFHWTYDTEAMANGTAAAVTKQGGESWFFITSDYAFGHALERDAMKVIADNGGKTLGAVRHPVSASDYSAFILQAQGSGAKIIGLANSTADLTTTIRQANEFGVREGGQNLAALLAFISDIHSLGLPVAQGINLTESFYWDLNDETRAWSKRFADRNGGRAPTMTQAGVYSAVNHYIKSVAAAQNTSGPVVAEKMRDIPVNDFMTKDAKILPNGWVNRDFYLFEVKKPEDSKSNWDYYNLVATIPAEVAKPSSSHEACALMSKPN